MNNMEMRFRIAGVIVVVLMAIIVARMFDVQVLEHGKYIALAEEQQKFEKTEIAKRGTIYAHDAIEESNSLYPLAFDVKKYQVLAIPNQISDKNKAANDLAPTLKLSAADVYRQINVNKLYVPPLIHGIEFDQAQQVRALKLSGIVIIPENSRYYSEGDLASQLLGFVNAEGKGNYGFEGHYDKELQGTSGTITGEQDTMGRIISMLDEKNAEDGASYVLTIDRSVQYFVEKQLKAALDTYQADSGTVLIMDIQTGGIVAMANLPSYNPNDFRQVAKDNPSLFVNPAIAYLYEPGSIFKPLVMSAAIDQGVVTPETQGTFDWHTFVGGFEIKTAERKAFGTENMTQVLQNSDNVAMVWLTEQLGRDKLYQYLEKYNFFDKTGIDLDTEVSGYTKPLNQWSDINRATISFGQGVAVSPIQLVAAYAALANGGVYEYPHIIDQILMPDGSKKSVEKREGMQIVKKETAATIAKMLQDVVDQGSSYRRVRMDGFKIAAKTGTAQIPKAGGGYEENDSGLGIYTHSVIGFAPADNPKYAMLVKLDRPKTALYAESTAAPVFNQISSFLLNFYYRVPANK